jgi:hypothetical protein
VFERLDLESYMKVQEVFDLLIVDIFPRGTYPPNKASLSQRRSLGHQLAKQLQLATTTARRVNRVPSTRSARSSANLQQNRWS